MRWNNDDANDPRVVQATRWIYLENYRNLQRREVVYIFANSAFQVKYIGKAGPGRIVDEIYNACYRQKHRGATRVKVLYTNSDTRAMSLEGDLIHDYCPPNNK